MKVDKNTNLIYKVVNNLIKEGYYRERKEFLKSYFNGLNWFENNFGGEKLNKRINILIDKAYNENNIICFEYQLKNVINDYNLLKSFNKKDIENKIQHLTFINEVKENPIQKIYNILN